MKEIIRAGLIKGRHELPVEKYIFEEEIEDVFDFGAMYEHCVKFIETEVGVCRTFGFGINQIDDYDYYGSIYVGAKALEVYVTGLTAVTVALVKVCAIYGIELTLYHYNRDTNEYVPQRVF